MKCFKERKKENLREWGLVRCKMTTPARAVDEYWVYTSGLGKQC